MAHGLGPVSQECQTPELYLDLLKRVLSNIIYEDDPLLFYDHLRQPQVASGFSLPRRVMGEDAPSEAHTMIGLRRLNNIQALIEDLLRRNVPGDLIETGVYRGGASIFMRAVLKAYRISDRRVFACDTFHPMSPTDIPWPVIILLKALASIPSKAWQRRLFLWLDRLPNSRRAFPVTQNPSDDWVNFSIWLLKNPNAMPDERGTGLKQVKSHFARYGLLDARVVFLEGFFADTLPTAPIKQLALMRLDGDSYESTMDALRLLYGRLSVGGYCIIDDYCAFSDCKRAVMEFRVEHQIDDEIVAIDNIAVYWRKS